LEDPLHREILEEHARSPMFHGRLKNVILRDLGSVRNPVIVVQLNFLRKILSCFIYILLHRVQHYLKLVHHLCVVRLKGMSQLESKLLSQKIITFIEKGKEFPLPGDLIVYETISRFSERHDCSLLPWRALLNAL
jgi:hypothetical protein